MDPSPSLAISIPCPRATSPGRSYCVHLLCVFLTCLSLSYSGTILSHHRSGLFFLARYLAFLHSPAWSRTLFIQAPLPSALALRINVPRANTLFLQVQCVSFEEAPVIDIIPRLDRNLLLRWTHFKLPVDWPILQPVCCPSDTRQTHLRNWPRVSLSRLFTHRPLPSASADGRYCS